jgi:hypothetical protein
MPMHMAEYKVTDAGKTIGGFAFGSSRLYKFIDMNPIIELRKIEYGTRTSREQARIANCKCNVTHVLQCFAIQIFLINASFVF